MKVKIIKKYLNRCCSLALDAVFPPVCIKCGKACESAGGVCADCFRKLTFVCEPFCHKCGRPLDDIAKEWGYCPFCNQTGKHCFDEARSALVYDESSSPLILALKYGDKTETVSLLSKWMTSAAADMAADMVVPVPLFRGRMLRRRYNQSALLAKSVAKAKKIKYEPLLERSRNTNTQEGLSFYGRRKNVKGAFNVVKGYDVRGKQVLLVDDVMTTGATLNECAKTLREAGATGVKTLTFAVVLK